MLLKVGFLTYLEENREKEDEVDEARKKEEEAARARPNCSNCNYFSRYERDMRIHESFVE